MAGNANSGRPPKFTQGLADTICARMADGMTVREICRQEDIPVTETAVRLWHVNDYKGFSSQYTKAREAQAVRWADEILEICDDGSNDWVERKNKDGSTYTQFDSEHYQRSRLRVDTRKWMLSKMLPKVYGDKLELSGDITNRTVSAEPISERDWQAQYQEEPKTNGAKKNGNGTAA